jgi:hypothetical protein
MLGISWLAKELIAFQEGPHYSRELVVRAVCRRLVGWPVDKKLEIIAKEVVVA